MDPTEYLRFFAALIFVLALIGAAAFALRAFGFMTPGGNRNKAERRMTIVESLMLDPRRRVLIVRRDNVEHVLLLGMSGETILERAIKLPEISTDPIPGTTFLTIRPEPRI
jgi:flagellar protein FliO/FliZ